jgi:hypothetical protein
MELQRSLQSGWRAMSGAFAKTKELPRFLYTREESARVLGISLRHFQRHVQPHLPCVYCGQLRLYRPADLERWVASEATPAGRAA